MRWKFMANKNAAASKSKALKREVYYKQPKFYSEFRCLGGKCPQTCCGGSWGIFWQKNEIDKVLESNCTEELKEQVRNTFLPHPTLTDTFYVQYTEKHECPLLTEDRMCSIQRELGADYMSHTCSVYPRKAWISGERAFRTCEMSCIGALELVCGSEDSMDVTYGKEKMVLRTNNHDTNASIAMHPELKYRDLLFDFFYGVISNKKYSVENGIILGAIAANAMTKCIEKKNFEHIPNLAEELKASFGDSANLKAIEGIKTNYTYKVGVCAKIIDLTVNPYVTQAMHDEDGSLNLDKYLQACERFERIVGDKPFMFRNIALNMLFECAMPFHNSQWSLFENYCYYAAAFAVIKMLGPAEILLNKHIDDDATLKRAYMTLVTLMSRKLFNNEPNSNKVLDQLKRFDCMSPAKIALLIK